MLEIFYDFPLRVYRGCGIGQAMSDRGSRSLDGMEEVCTKGNNSKGVSKGRERDEKYPLREGVKVEVEELVLKNVLKSVLKKREDEFAV